MSGLVASRMFPTVMSWLETPLKSFARLSAVVDQIPRPVCKVRSTVLQMVMEDSIMKSNHYNWYYRIPNKRFSVDVWHMKTRCHVEGPRSSTSGTTWANRCIQQVPRNTIIYTSVYIYHHLAYIVRRYVTLVRFNARVWGAEQLAHHKKWQRLTGPLWGDSAPAMRNAGVLSKSLA